MNRVTEKELQAICDRINEACGTPLRPYLDGKPQAKCYHLSYAYGGVTLHQMSESGSGIRDVFSGYMPKRELASKMHAFLKGVQSAAAYDAHYAKLVQSMQAKA